MGNVRWRGYDHPTMYDMINSGPGADASTPITTYWEGLSKELDGINSDLNDGLSKLKVNWEGDAAQSAQGGLNPLQQWSQDAQTGADVMKISSVDQAQYVSSARSSMPEPVAVTTPEPGTWDKVKAAGLASLGIDGPANQVAQQSADHEAQEAAQQAAAQKAVQTMETYQSSSEWNSSTLGTFVPSPDVVVSVNPTSGQTVTHVQSQEQGTPTTSSNTSGTTHASGLVAPSGPTGGLPTNPTLNQPNTPVQTTPTTTTPVSTTPPIQTTSPNWATPPTTTNPTGPTNPVPNGPTGNQPFPTETNPGGGNTNTPTGPGGRGPITGPVTSEPGEGPVRTSPTGPGGRGGLSPTGEGPNRGGVPRGGVPNGGLNEQTRNPNSRLRPGSGPNAFEEGGRNGGRANIGARSASAYNYGEGPNGTRGGVNGEPGGTGGRGGTGSAGRGGVGGGAGGRGGAGDGSRGGNRFIRNANAAAEAEERLGGRGGNAGANGSKGSGGRMGRGQRGEDEDEHEYQHADYLVDTEDVFLDDRLVAPPVIGERNSGA